MTETVDTTTLKDAFAFHLLVSNGNVLTAATAVAPENLHFRLMMAKYWPDDPYVIARKTAYLTEYGEAFFLPNKYDIARKLIEVSDKAIHAEDRLKALKQYAELMGMVEKAGAVKIDQSVTVNRVMVVERHGDDDDWERQAIAQQARLTIDHAPTE